MFHGNISKLVNEELCLIVNLNNVDVPEAEFFMDAASQLRASNLIPDLLLFMSHPKTIATGLRDSKSDKPKDLLVSRKHLEREGIAFVCSVRGGGITYHWPGQVVCYPVIALKSTERDISRYMSNLEQVCIETLRVFGLEASRRRDSAAHLGLWLNGKKIVSMGIRVKKWITSFGFALNLEGDISPSNYLNPCGLKGVKLTTVEEALGRSPKRCQVIHEISKNFQRLFQRRLQFASEPLIREIKATYREALAGYDAGHYRSMPNTEDWLMVS